MSHTAIPLTRPTNDLPDFDRFRKRLHAVNGRSKRTAASYTTHARLFTDWATRTRPGTPLLELGPEDVEDYLIDQADRGVAQATRRLAVYGIRALYDFLSRQLTTPVNPARQVKPPSQPPCKTLDYSTAELDRLLAAARHAADAAHGGDHNAWVRARFDHAVLATFRYTGVRLSELLNMHTGHPNLDRRQVEVLGKGAKHRHIPIPDQLVCILDAYLTEVRPHCPASPYLFANPDGQPGSAVYGKLAERAAFDIVVKYANAADLPGHHHPHRLRHSYSTDLLRRGASLESIRKLLGHASILTTQRYLHVSDGDLADTIHRVFTDTSSTMPAPSATTGGSARGTGQA